MKVRLAAVGALVCALALMVGGAGAVPSTSLVISQIYGGGGNTGATYTNDFIELFNRGSSPISLNGWSVQYAATTGTNWQKTDLTNVTLQPGQYYLVQEAPGAGGTTPLPTPDASGAIAMSASAGKVALVSNQTLIPAGTSCPSVGVVDFIGYGSTTNCSEGAPAPGLTNTTADLRGGGGCTETDNNATDFATGAPAPRNTASPLNACSGPPSLSINDVSAQEGNSGTTAFTFTVSLSSPAGAGGVTFDIATADNTATAPSDYAPQSLTGQTIPTGSSTYPFTVQVNGDTGTEPDETFFVDVTNVTGATVADGQGQGTIVTDDVCGLPSTSIHSIQGSGSTSPLVGATVDIEGVVVGDFQGTGRFGGFHVQEEDADADGNPATSEGIFVFSTLSDVAAGDIVRVRGRVIEFATGTGTLTELTSVNAITVCSTGAEVTTTDVSMPFAALDFPERYEGMLVRLPQPLVISEYFNYDRFGEMVLALPLEGEPRPFTPTAIVEPGAPALARLLANQLRRITLDDGLNIQNPAILRHPNGAAFSLANLFRGGDTVQNTVGVLTFGSSLYRIQPTGPADYTVVNPRPAEPEPVGGTLRVVAMNTLNFFVTADYPTGNPLDNKCGPLQNVECRGWDFDQPTEFTRQRDKLLAALVGLDGDVVGLNELENTTGVDPLGGPSGIVPGLNAILGAGTYAAIDTGTIGTDAIKVGLIYKPATVMPVGDFELLTTAVDPRFLDTKSRPVLAQTFEVIATGARFTVAVNHLKSKGSACDDVGDPDASDGQGNCNRTRTLAAQALVDWLATDPTGSGDPDFLIMGDLNSYAQEDPVDAIKAGPDDTAGTADDYTNLVAQFLGPFAYSFVFDGMAGYLDHALSSPSLTSQVSGVAEWHIDADEPDVLDYDTSFKPPEQDALYEANASRVSDHDPILVGLTATTSFADLCRLTHQFVTKPGIAAALCEKLATAEAADASGDTKTKQNAINSYINQVEAQTGKSITPERAEVLIALARML